MNPTFNEQTSCIGKEGRGHEALGSGPPGRDPPGGALAPEGYIVVYQVPGTWARYQVLYLVPSIWDLVPGTWYDVWYQKSVPVGTGTRLKQFGTKMSPNGSP